MENNNYLNKVKPWLNNLHENKVIYKERFITFAELENIKFDNDIFSAQIKPLKMIYLPRFFRNKEEKTEEVLNSSWTISFRLTPTTSYTFLRLDDQMQKISTYSCFTMWTKPNLVQKAELLIKNSKPQEVIKLILRK